MEQEFVDKQENLYLWSLLLELKKQVFMYGPLHALCGFLADVIQPTECRRPSILRLFLAGKHHSSSHYC
jgi:hypothetical protein